MKTFELTCPKHGKVRIEVEKPPLLALYSRCPFCDVLLRTRRVEEKKPKPIWARG